MPRIILTILVALCALLTAPQNANEGLRCGAPGTSGITVYGNIPPIVPNRRLQRRRRQNLCENQAECAGDLNLIIHRTMGRRRKNRTHLKGGVASAPGTAEGVPKSFVIKHGKVGTSLTQLVRDVRRVMEPNTASRLRVSISPYGSAAFACAECCASEGTYTEQA